MSTFGMKRDTHARLNQLTALVAEAPYIRGLGWDVFTTCWEDEDHDDEDHDIDEIQRVDSPEISTPGYVACDIGYPRDGDHAYDYFFEFDDEAWLLVLFLALDGDPEAKQALREIGCTARDFPCLKEK